MTSGWRLQDNALRGPDAAASARIRRPVGLRCSRDRNPPVWVMARGVPVSTLRSDGTSTRIAAIPRTLKPGSWSSGRSCRPLLSPHGAERRRPCPSVGERALDARRPGRGRRGMGGRPAVGSLGATSAPLGGHRVDVLCSGPARVGPRGRRWRRDRPEPCGHRVAGFGPADLLRIPGDAGVSSPPGGPVVRLPRQRCRVLGDRRDLRAPGQQRPGH